MSETQHIYKTCHITFILHVRELTVIYEGGGITADQARDDVLRQQSQEYMLETYVETLHFFMLQLCVSLDLLFCFYLVV